MRFRWLRLTIAVAFVLYVGRLWQRVRRLGYYDVNEDSARRRLAALMPPIKR